MQDSGGTQANTVILQGLDSPYAWFRLVISLILMIIGGSGMYMAIIVLPELQQEFGVARAQASMPYTFTMVGFGIGGVLMGRLADRYGVWLPIMVGGSCLCAGFLLGGSAASLWYFSLVQGLFVGMLGSSASFAPLMANTSLWFLKRRGIAVGIVASGNYLAGAIWPPLVRHWVDAYGWRDTMMGIGLFCLITMLPLAPFLRRRAPDEDGRPQAASGSVQSPESNLGISANALLALLCMAGLACCIAMAMPQVHIVAYCTDLGYGAVKGAQMLSVMLASGVVSRLVFGVISDRIGGLRTLLLGSALQGVALILFIPFQDLASLFGVSALFGLFQGGIVPAYAIIVREYFAPQVAATRVGIVIMFTLAGMAIGGWMSGWIFDLSGSYEAAFINGIGWNLVNLLIVLGLLYRQRRIQLGLITANRAA